MLLTPTERILLLNILPPAEGNALLLRSVRRLRGSLAFSDSEIVDWKITSPGAGIFNWDAAVSESVDIDISNSVLDYVKQCLQAADAAGRLHEGLLNIYDHFFPQQE